MENNSQKKPKGSRYSIIMDGLKPKGASAVLIGLSFLAAGLFLIVGISMFAFAHNIVVLVVSVVTFVLYMIALVKSTSIILFFIKSKIKRSGSKLDATGQVLDYVHVGEVTIETRKSIRNALNALRESDGKVSLEVLTGGKKIISVVMGFVVEVDGQEYLGYKTIRVNKLLKDKDFGNDEMKRIVSDIQENGGRLQIEYAPGYNYCTILDDEYYLLNYFIAYILR